MRRAFTMVEMLVAMALLILLVSLGIGMSMNTLKMKKFQAVYDGLLADLQMARSNAISGKKDATCGTTVLSAWIVTILSNVSYQVSVMCLDQSPIVTKTVSFANVVISPTSATIKFKPLGLGTDLSSQTILTLSSGTFTPKQIIIYPSGEIQ